MGIGAILELIIAVLKAPAEIRALILLLSKTPEERRQEILAKIQKESDSLDHGGRPEWGE